MTTSSARSSGTSEAGTHHGTREQPGSLSAAVDRMAENVKPRLRGWIHLGVTPFVIIASAVLVVLSPTPAARWSCAVFGLTAILLFGTSAVYHRGRWSPGVSATLRRLDHTNIFLIIAGTYTPLAVLLLPYSTARTLLIIAWSGALVGLLARVFWLGAPRWVYVPVYVALGSVSVWYIPAFYRSGGAAIVFWIALGGLAYVLGAVVYGIKRPNPSPRWFGFHEIFHVLTVVGYGSHYVAVSMASYRS